MNQDTNRHLPDVGQLAYQVVERLKGDLSPSNPAQAYANVIIDELTRHRDAQVAYLRELVVHWETVSGRADTTLYSLGLRHAIDVLLGVDPSSIRHETT